MGATAPPLERHMDKAPPSHPWYRRRRTDTGHVSEDAADLGTAFGLDLSLRDAAEATVPLGASPQAARPGWAQRMLTRHKR
jgi:hypothetical protein